MPILDPEIEIVRVILPRPQLIRLSDTEIAPGNFGGEFIDLTDVPNSYAGQSLKVVRVNTGETGLEFFTATDFSGLFIDLDFTNSDTVILPLLSVIVGTLSQLTGDFAINTDGSFAAGVQVDVGTGTNTSIDANTRKLYQTDGTTVAFDWSSSQAVVKASSPTPTTLNEVIALLQAAGLCS